MEDNWTPKERYVSTTLLDTAYSWQVTVDSGGMLDAHLKFRVSEYHSPETVLTVSAFNPEDLAEEMFRAEKNVYYVNTGKQAP